MQQSSMPAMGRVTRCRTTVCDKLRHVYSKVTPCSTTPPPPTPPYTAPCASPRTAPQSRGKRPAMTRPHACVFNSMRQRMPSRLAPTPLRDATRGATLVCPTRPDLLLTCPLLHPTCPVLSHNLPHFALHVLLHVLPHIHTHLLSHLPPHIRHPTHTHTSTPAPSRRPPSNLDVVVAVHFEHVAALLHHTTRHTSDICSV